MKSLPPLISIILFLSISNHQPKAAEAATAKRLPHLVESDGQVQRVSVGRTAKFKCIVNDLGDHKVIWFHKEKRLPLVINNQVNIWKDRLHASSQGNSVFFLQLDNVQVSDKGHFSCQLNTQPLMSQVHVLDVVKPPQIKEEETTINVEPVKEFGSLELRCAADGIPKPTIKWRRESQMHVLPPTTYDDDADDEWYDSDLQQATEVPSIQNDQATTSSTGSSTSKGQERTGDIKGGASSGGIHQRTRREVSNAIDATTQPPTIDDGESDVEDGDDAYNDDTNADKRKASKELSQQQTDATASTTTTTTTTTLQPPTTATTLANANSGSSGLKSSNSSTANPFMAEGEVLRFDRISRYDMGFYMCIASNGVPPSVSQRIFVPVSFVHTPRVGGQRALTSSARRSDELAAAAATDAADVNKASSGKEEATISTGSKATRSRISPTARRGGLGGGAAARRRANNNSSSSHHRTGGSSAAASSSATSNTFAAATGGHHHHHNLGWLFYWTTTLTAIVVIVVGGRWI